MAILVLTTDFGVQDHYVGVMKGVILGIAPNATIVDLTHEITPFSVLHGALVLRQAWDWFPPKTIHVAVVDPGVGTPRRCLIAEFENRFLIAPDNGLLTLLVRQLPTSAMFEIEVGSPGANRISYTFHGRDVLAPAAAKIFLGAPPASFGPPLRDPVELNLPVAERLPGCVRGQVIHVDHFGTLITNVSSEVLTDSENRQRNGTVFVDSHCVGPIRSTYADVPRGDFVAVMGSSGFLEIAVNQGRASEVLDRNARVEVRTDDVCHGSPDARA